MHHPINLVIYFEERDSVQRDNRHEPEHLLAEVPPAPPHQQDGQRRGAAPVRSACQRTPDDRNQRFQPVIPFLIIPGFQQEQPPQQRPGNAGLVEDHVLNGIETWLCKIAESEMADHSKQRHPANIFPEVPGMVISFSNKEKT